ncbi:piggyBac transposable element-derived protein 4 [Trichonephila clavipes]|nr:piggyBac transposable element-derived protein 4 [Trichonephila clavipes]
MMDSGSKSENSEFNISNSEDDSSDLSTHDIFSESSESENDDISSARMWVEEKTVCPATPCFDFTESPGILVNFSDDTLIQYFEYFFDDSMLELIVEETNVYAEQCFHSHKSKMHSKQREWRATCKEETLMKPLLNKGYCVTLDNYYSSPILTDTLVKYKTDSYETINLNRKEVPSYVKKVIAVRSSREEKLKPKIVVDYHDTMGGVDRADQNLASYAIPRKYGKKKRDSDGKKIRKETRYYCEKCDVGLCVVPCFEKFHTQRDIY